MAHFSRHAHERMAQRGTRLSAAQLLHAVGDRRIHLGNGRAIIALSHDRAEALRGAGFSRTTVDRLANVSLLVDEITNDVVTVLKGALSQSYRSGRGHHHRGGKRGDRLAHH